MFAVCVHPLPRQLLLQLHLCFTVSLRISPLSAQCLHLDDACTALLT